MPQNRSRKIGPSQLDASSVGMYLPAADIPYLFPGLDLGGPSDQPIPSHQTLPPQPVHISPVVPKSIDFSATLATNTPGQTEVSMSSQRSTLPLPITPQIQEQLQGSRRQKLPEQEQQTQLRLQRQQLDPGLNQQQQEQAQRQRQQQEQQREKTQQTLVNKVPSRRYLVIAPHPITTPPPPPIVTERYKRPSHPPPPPRPASPPSPLPLPLVGSDGKLLGRFRCKTCNRHYNRWIILERHRELVHGKKKQPGALEDWVFRS